MPFRWMLGSSWASNIGDGIALAAGPLLVASQTDEVFLVALAATFQWLPWLVLGLWAGVVADRLDRRRVIIVANLLRAVVVAVLCAVILTGHVNIAVVLVAMLLFGIAEVFVDTTSQTLLPMLVRRDDLGTGNARLQAGYLTANQLVGPPVGAALFAAGMAWPFLVQIVCLLLAVVLVSRMALPERLTEDHTPAARSRVRQDIAEGLRWTWNHAAIRTLIIVILVFNITWAATWSVLVKYSLDHLGMSEIGFGLLTAATAVGGIVATFVYGPLERRFSLTRLMRVALTLEVFFHLALALAVEGWQAIVILFCFGVYALVWGTVSRTLRQRAVPERFQGRVASVNGVASFGGLVVGSLIGGVLAQAWGLTAPMWFAFIGAALTLVLMWRQLGHVSAAALPDEPPATTE